MAKRGCRNVILIGFTFLMDILDFVNDWIVCNSAMKAEKGLVYGPVSDAIVFSLLAFCIIGTIGFIIESGVFVYSLKWLDNEMDEDDSAVIWLDWVSLIFIWFENIPQIVLSFAIIMCRDEAISIFQIIKAVSVLVGDLVCGCITIIHCCRTLKCKYTTKFAVKMAILIGIIIEMGFAITVLCLTQTELNQKGDVSVRVPTTVFDEKLDDQPYFSDVSLFVHQSDLVDAWSLDANKKDAPPSWMRLASLYDIKENKYMSFKIDYEHVNSHALRFAIRIANVVKTTPVSKWTLSECYSLDQDTTEITLLPNSSCESSTSNSSQTFFTDFRFEEPDNSIVNQKYVLGEIFVNMKVWISGICLDGNYDNKQKNNGTQFYPLTFHYFRVNKPQNDGVLKHLFRDEFNGIRFFRENSQEITDVAKVWKTGRNKCTTTGSTEPVLDTNMQTQCL